MVFDANGNLIDGNDGGIYRRTSPQNNTGNWFSVIGNLQITEFHDIAYDNNSNIIIGGAQDTGTPEQTATGNTTAATGRTSSTSPSRSRSTAIDAGGTQCPAANYPHHHAG